eukprot:750697-Hanusia_phi.AAC.3
MARNNQRLEEGDFHSADGSKTVDVPEQTVRRGKRCKEKRDEFKSWHKMNFKTEKRTGSNIAEEKEEGETDRQRKTLTSFLRQHPTQ